MSAFEERLELEHSICDLQKKVGDDGITLEQKRISLKYALESAEEARLRVLHHRKNLTYMRTKADYVNLMEYRGTVSLLEEARDKYEEESVKVAGLQQAVAHYTEAVTKAEVEIERKRGVLGSYGKIVPWRAS